MSDKEKILGALRDKPLKIYEIMKRANISHQESYQSLLLKMRDEGAVKFDIRKGRWSMSPNCLVPGEQERGRKRPSQKSLASTSSARGRKQVQSWAPT